jgi:hypothetical protein
MRYLLAAIFVLSCSLCYAESYDAMKQVDEIIRRNEEREYRKDMREYAARQASAEERRERQEAQNRYNRNYNNLGNAKY